MRATFSGIAKIVVLALGVGGFVASAGSASAADACKTYVKANYAKPACDYKIHQMMMHKKMAAHVTHKKMAAHKMMHKKMAAKKPAMHKKMAAKKPVMHKKAMAKKKVVHKKKKAA